MNSLLRLDGLDRLWNVLDGEWRGVGEGLINPAAEVREDENAYTLHAEIPGVDKKDVHVTLEDGVLTISGEKRFEKEEKGKGRYHLVERSYGSFRRSFRLPVPSGDKVEARFKDGVLTVTVPKAPEAKAQEITIRD